MGKIVVNCSSIYNIDFSCAVFYKICQPDLDLLFYLNDKATISKNSANRKYISRLAIPLFEWEKDNEGNWKVLHYPLEQIESLSEFLYILEKATNTIKDFANIDRVKSNNVQNTLEVINNKIRHEFIDKEFNSILAYSILISEITKRTLKLNEDIDIHFYGGIYEGTVKNEIHNKALLSIYNYLYSNSYIKSISFIQGGKISVNINNQWLDYDGASLDNDGLRLINKSNNSFHVISLNELNSNFLNNYIRFIGPLETLLFMQLGFCADLPSYSSAQFTNNKLDNAEYISPISVTDISRVSKKYGGKGFRLIPSGYSLLDYHHDANSNVMNLIRGILKDPKIELEHLDEWFDLINNYPRVDEKISESQSSIKRIISAKEKDFRLAFRDMQINNKVSSEDFGFFSVIDFGIRVLKLMAILNTIRESLSPYNKITISDAFLTYLEEIGFSSNNKIQTSVIVSYYDRIYNYSILLFQNINLDKISLQEITSKHLTYYDLVKHLQPFPINSKSTEMYDNNSVIASLNKVLAIISYEYYTFIVFLLTSVLKANIFNAAFCLGFEDYYTNIKSIIEKRASDKFLHYKPIFFKIHE
jgi:hypothetical protein